MQVYGPDPNANPVQYYINPIGIKSFSFSARELNPQTARVSRTPTESSIDVQILDDNVSIGPRERVHYCDLYQCHASF